MFWIALVGLAAAALVYVRAAPGDPSRWHVDPLEIGRPATPNQTRVAPPGRGSGDLVSPIFDVEPQELARRLDRVALAEPRTRRFAGRPEAGLVTYVQRSLLFGFPDYVSVKAVAMGEGRSALALFSRSRFGYSDLGVNRRRAERWLAALTTAD